MQLLHPKLNTLRTQAPSVPTIQVLAIEIQDLKLAIPLEFLMKVIRTPTILKSGETWMGMTHLDQDSLLVIDLHHKIYGTNSSESINHLVIIRDSRQGNDRLFGIPVSKLPTLVSLPINQIQDLPREYRDRDVLGIANKIAILNQPNQTATLFILDPDRLFQTSFSDV